MIEENMEGYTTCEMAIDTIAMPEMTRELREISSLAQSIQEIGLTTPIIVVENDPDFFTLVDGRRRLAAFKQLGRTHIPVTIRSISEVDARLATLDGNLESNSLTMLERNEWLAEKSRLYKARHPETQEHIAGGIGKSRANSAGDPGVASTKDAPLPFRELESKRHGVTPDALNRWIKSAEDMADEAKSIVRGTPVANNQRALNEIARLPKTSQTLAAECLVKGNETATSLENKRKEGKITATQIKDTIEALGHPVQIQREEKARENTYEPEVTSRNLPRGCIVPKLCHTRLYTKVGTRGREDQDRRLTLSRDITNAAEQIADFWDEDGYVSLIKRLAFHATESTLKTVIAHYQTELDRRETFEEN